MRLKKDIVDTGSSLEWLARIRIRDYTVKATGERKTGVIAQELQDVHPDMVHEGPNGFLSVDQPEAWRFVKAIQELKALADGLGTKTSAILARIDGDDAEIKALKAANENESARLKALEAKFDALSKSKAAPQMPAKTNASAK